MTHREATRRQVLRGIGATASAVPLASLFGCSDDPAGEGGGESGGGSSSGGPSTDTSSSATTVTSAESSTSVDATGAASESEAGSGTTAVDGSESESGTECAMIDGWATGGTAAMCADYPDPFAGGIQNPCELLCSA